MKKKAAVKKTIRILRTSPFIISVLVSLLAASISSLFITIFLNPPELDKADLQAQIKEVENAIGNLRNLENYLKKTKDDMIATKQAKDKIEEEYSKAKELEKLTDRQIEAISLAVNKRTKADVFWGYFWGFVVGVASSLLASYIYGRLRKKKDENKQPA